MQKFKIMDYSLLLIVEENPEWTKEIILMRKNSPLDDVNATKITDELLFERKATVKKLKT